MSAIIFITASKPLKLSAYFLAGVVIAVTAGVTITYTVATTLGNSISLGDPSNSGSLGNIIQNLLVGLLVFLSIKNYVRRETIEPPGWLGALQNAKPRTAFTTGLLLLFARGDGQAEDQSKDPERPHGVSSVSKSCSSMTRWVRCSAATIAASTSAR